MKKKTDEKEKDCVKKSRAVTKKKKEIVNKDDLRKDELGHAKSYARKNTKKKLYNILDATDVTLRGNLCLDRIPESCIAVSQKGLRYLKFYITKNPCMYKYNMDYFSHSLVYHSTDEQKSRGIPNYTVAYLHEYKEKEGIHSEPFLDRFDNVFKSVIESEFPKITEEKKTAIKEKILDGMFKDDREKISEEEEAVNFVWETVVKQMLERIQDIDEKYCYDEIVSEFICSMLSDFIIDLRDSTYGRLTVHPMYMQASMMKKVEEALDICDNSLIDYEVLKEIKEALEFDRDEILKLYYNKSGGGSN